MAEPKEGRVARQQVAPASKQAKTQATEADAGRQRSTGMEDDPPQSQASFDCGPWAETPSSSRVASYRFDYHNRAIQVRWRNGKSQPGHIYRDVPYEVYRSFARVASKGKYVNSTLNGYDYDLMTPDEAHAPSNERRQGVSRSRG